MLVVALWFLSGRELWDQARAGTDLISRAFQVFFQSRATLFLYENTDACDTQHVTEELGLFFMSLIGSLVAHPVMRSCCSCWCPKASYSKVRPIGISYRSCVCVYVCVSQCASVLSTDLDRTTNWVVDHDGGFRIDQITTFCDPNIQTWSSIRPSVLPPTSPFTRIRHLDPLAQNTPTKESSMFPM